MATVDVGTEAVTVRLTTAEKLAAWRGDLVFPRSSVTSVETFDDGLAATRGLRAPGLAIPRRRRIGTWRRRHGKELVSVRGGQPAVRIELASQPFTAVVLGVDDADRLAASLGVPAPT